MNNARAFNEIAKKLCNHDRWMKKNNLHLLTNDLEGTFELEDVPQNGVTYKRAGAVVHIFHCTPVNVMLRDINHCTQVIASN